MEIAAESIDSTGRVASALCLLGTIVLIFVLLNGMRDK